MRYCSRRGYGLRPGHLVVLGVVVCCMLPRIGAAQVASAADQGTAGAAIASVSPELQQLRSEVERLVLGASGSDSRWSVLVVSLQRGDTLFAMAPDLAVAPASNVKLFTAAAALHYLGAGFRYATYLLRDGPVTDGVVEGDLIVYGTGDPTLRGGAASIWATFADSLEALGIHEIRGRLVGDGSYFVGSGVGIGWRNSYMNASYAAPANALSFNENIASLQILPGEEEGWRPRVRLNPGEEGIAVVNVATTVAGTATRIAVERAAYDGPVVVRGGIGIGSPGVWRTVPIGDGPRFAMAAFRQVLESRGIRVLGGIDAVTRPEASVLTARSIFAPAFKGSESIQPLAVYRSAPLLQILETVNIRSHNMYAEMVLRTVGRVASGEGTIVAGARATLAMLGRDLEAWDETLRIMDGSGLSTLNRASAGHVVELLVFAARSDFANPFWSSLPVAAVDRQFQRMHNTPAADNLRAKTGTIDGVSALSGYVRSGDDELLAFSILSNGVSSTWRAKRAEDAIGVRLAQFRRGETAPDEAVVADVPPLVEERYHVVRSGDTLDAIARRYGTTVRALENANPGIRPRRLIPGQRIRLP